MNKRRRTVRRLVQVLAWFLVLSTVVRYGMKMAEGEGASVGDGRLGGDYPAFYGAGAALRRGLGDVFYDSGVQSKVQHDLGVLPGEGPGTYLAFAYPPFVALFYKAFAFFEYRTSYVLHMAFMTLMAIAAILWMRDRVPIGLLTWDTILALGLIFMPIFESIRAGQNTTFTLLLLVGLWQGLAKDRDWVTGLCLAGLLFKPQFFVLPFFMVAQRRRWGALGWMGFAAGLLMVLSVVFVAPTSLGDWWAWASAFRESDADRNAPYMITLWDAVPTRLGQSPWSRGLGYALCALGAGGFLFLCSRKGTLDSLFPWFFPVLILTAPHAVYYESALLFPTIATFVARGRLWIATLAFLSAYLMNLDRAWIFLPLALAFVGAWPRAQGEGALQPAKQDRITPP
ncbi:MAG: DUF2029 domain-containing protein [Myxococcales bacterium]|nr:DUF2029 domain-containing protein [Myxococcales bacterium]